MGRSCHRRGSRCTASRSIYRAARGDPCRDGRPMQGAGTVARNLMGLPHVGDIHQQQQFIPVCTTGRSNCTGWTGECCLPDWSVHDSSKRRSDSSSDHRGKQFRKRNRDSHLCGEWFPLNHHVIHVHRVPPMQEGRRLMINFVRMIFRLPKTLRSVIQHEQESRT